jgi:hypothetical protein
MFESQAINPTSHGTTTTAGDTADGDAHETARMTWRRLRLAGLSPREAGSLTAHLSGLNMVPGGWAIEELERLLFVRELVRTGRMGS